MAMTKADIRISTRRGDGATRKIELIALPFADKYRVRIDGKKSQKLEVTTITQVTHKLREWLCKGVK